MKRVILILLAFMFCSSISNAANYTVNLKSRFEEGLVHVHVTKKYYVHLNGLGDSFYVSPKGNQIVQVTGNQDADWHASDLIFSIFDPSSRSYTIRIHEIAGKKIFYDIYIGGNKVDKVSEDKLNGEFTIVITPNGPHIGPAVDLDWMSSLSSDISLNKIIIPGSHDAGMAHPVNCTIPILSISSVRTQRDDIAGQLESGSRYFDIRPSYSDSMKGWITYHRSKVVGVSGVGCNGQTILRYDSSGFIQKTDILEEVYTFLKRNPTEMVILNISHPRFGDGKGAQDLLDNIVDFNAQHGSIFYPKTNISFYDLKLSDLRGRAIIVLSDDIYNSADKKNEIFWSQSGFPIYNEYSNTTDIAKMKKDQLNKLSTSGGLGQNKLFLLSWTLTAGESHSSVELLAKVANKALPDAIESDMVYKQPNIVYLDFIDSNITQPIIKLSYKYSSL